MLNGDKKNFFFYLALTVIYGVLFVEILKPFILSVSHLVPSWAREIFFGLGLLPIWLLGGTAMWYGKKIGGERDKN